MSWWACARVGYKVNDDKEVLTGYGSLVSHTTVVVIRRTG